MASLLDFDATLQVIQQKLDGTKVWLAEWSAVAEALFLPTGKLDWRDQGSAPDSPPPTRVRSFVVDRVLQFVDENGLLGNKGELIGTDVNGIRRVLTPGPPGSVLIRDPSSEPGISWAQSLAVSEIAGQFQAGSVWNYQGTPSPSPAGQVQYTRVELTKDQPINAMTVYRGLGGNNARFVNLGIYDQADSLDRNGTPRNRLVETGPVDTTGTNSYLAPAIGPFVVPASGFYWLAFVTDTAFPLTWAVTNSFPQDFVPVYRETSAGTTLPATAGVITNPASAVVFVAATE